MVYCTFSDSAEQAETYPFLGVKKRGYVVRTSHVLSGEGTKQARHWQQEMTGRLKGPGMRWDKSNAEAMMALAGLHHSGLGDTYWKSRRAVASSCQAFSSHTCGNTSDKTTLKEFLQKIERPYGQARRIWVMDRGIPTE